MIFDWYKVLNRAEFEAAGLVSKEVEMILDGVGQKTILVTKGNVYSILVDGVYLSIGLGGKNPFVFGGYAVYLDSNDDIWMGIATSEN
jgi:hypothetical protein